MSWLRDGLAWRWRRLRRQWFLLRSFRNGVAVVKQYRRRLPCDCVVCWDGTVFRHPAGRLGLPETILEIWLDQVYTGTFYRPAAGDVVIDAGANVGLFSVWLARKYPGCRVVAFEPFAENFELLRQNIHSAGVSSVEAHQAALGAATGFGTMSDGGNRSLDHRLEGTGPGGAAAGGIPVYGFADVLRTAKAETIALFKVDIEGSEYDLFGNAAAEDLKRVARFAIEYHDNLRPGTLEFLRSRLSDTHTVTAHAEGAVGYGMLYATLKPLA